MPLCLSGTKSTVGRFGGCWVRLLGKVTSMSSRADYFRRQADICLRLSLISSSEEVANRLVLMAQDYRTKADAIVAEPKSSLPTEATNHPPDYIRK
jgi:hypothetical protein